jgi:diguanylate cyclase (GGDEF)-like protein/PAS domain S-box-containing protein
VTAPADSATWAGPDGPGPRPHADPGRLLRVVAAQRDLACTAEDATAVFELLAECVLSIFAAEGALVAQPVGADIVARASVGSCGPTVGTTIPQAGTLAGLALSTLEPQICRDCHSDPRTRVDINEQAGIRSSIIVPLVDAGEPLGIVLALSSIPYAFDEGDLALLTLLADVAASSLSRALLRGQRADLEEGRRRDDARLRAAQELTGLAWWALDVATDRHEWSDAMFRLVGLEPSDRAPGSEEFLALLHPDDRPGARDLAGRGYVAGHGDVFRVVHPDGSVHFLQSWTDIETDADGRTSRVVGATIDVTEREEVRASLAASQANLAAALELTRTATWEWDVRQDRIIWSDRMTELMGWPLASRATPRVEDFLSCVHPDDRDRMRALGEQTIATGRGEEAVYRIRLRDGKVRHVRAWTDVRTAPDGSVVALWGTAMDITDQVAQTSRLAASEEHFRVAFDNAPIGMSMISLAPDTTGRYLRANRAFAEMVGYAHDDLVGRHILELTHPADTERDAGFLRRLVDRETTTVAFEKRYRRPDGTAVQAWLTSSVVHDADGRPLYLVSHAMDITDRLREQAELERLALTDTLTGLANRTLLDDRLDQALARLQRAGGVCAMLLLDVDRFKLVNDSLGHQVGDALLVEIAGRLETVTRAETTVARLGGDEFVVLVEGLRAPEDVHVIAERLLGTLRRPYALGPTAEALVATVSLGISVAASPDRTHLDLYREADLALYRAKDAGRDQYALFDDALRARADARLESETLLRRALADDRLVALLQPIVDLGDGRVHAAEGLARIETEDGRLVMPLDFIDVAEETGLIVEVDSRMVERVAAAYAALSHADRATLRTVTTNVSARSLEDPAFVDRVRRALSWYGVPGSAMRVELTERSLLTTSPLVRESLDRLAALGVQVGLDDFGTGYSALAYLQRFALQFLKIDRSFVSRLGMSARDDAVVAAVIDLAHAHDLVVVAEGVETAEQLQRLRAMGCDRAQGYLLGRPMRPAALEDLLRADPRW